MAPAEAMARWSLLEPGRDAADTDDTGDGASAAQTSFDGPSRQASGASRTRRAVPEDEDRGGQTERRRVTRACDVCSKRRRRCDGNLPCGLCSANNRDCTYSKQPAKRGPRRRRQGEETGNSPAEAAAQWGSSGDREPLGTCGGYPRFEDGSMAEDLLYFDGSGLPLFSLPLEGRQALVDEGLEQLLEGENPTKSKIAPDAAQSFVDSAFRSLESRDAMLPMNNYARISDDGPHLPTDDGMALTDSISSIRSNSDDSRLAVSRPGAQMGLIVSQIARPVSPESRPPMPFTAQLAHLISSDTLISSGATPTVTPIAERSEARTRATGAASPKNFKRPRSDGGWQMPLPGSKKEVEAMFRTMPSFRGHIPNPGSSVQVPLVRAPGIMDDLEPLPNQGTMTELINRFFEDLFVASPILHKPSFLKTLHLRPPYLLYALGSIAAPYCSHIPNRLSISLNLLERCLRLLLPAGAGPGSKTCEMVIALFYGSLAASRSWKKGYAQLTATLIEMAVRIARELGLNAEPRETTAIPPRNSFLAKGISTVSPNQSWNSEYGLPRWIVDEERRRIWWQLYVLDKVSMAVSDRPAQISERDCQARIPCSNYIWLREAESHETHGVNLGSELLGIPAQSMFSGFGETVWSEVGAWVVVFRAIGVVFGEFHQFCQEHKVEPFADPAEHRRKGYTSNLPMQLTYHQEEILRRFDAARELLDATYDRLPPYFHEIDVDPIQYTLRNWENLRQFRNREKHRPIVPYDNDGHSGPPPDRHTVLEALYLLMIMHNAYAMLHAPRNPHPALPSTQNWTKHQAVMGILGSPTRPIMKMASGPNGVLDILRWFPFMSMTRGPYPMSMADGSALHDFGDMENWPPSPAAICHFHCCKVTELQRTIMMLDEQLVSIPAFCLWCSAQTVIYRLLLSSLTVIKVINEAILEGKQMTVSEATNAVLADINLHTDLMEKLSKRWPAAMAAFIMTKHIVARALEGSMQEDHDALFTTVGIISEPGQAKVDNLIGRMDELEIGGMKLDQPPAPKKTHVASVSPAGSGSSRRGSVLGDVAGSIDSLPPIAELKPSSYSDSSTRKPQRGPVPTSGPVAAAAPPQPNMHSMPGPEPRSQITNFVDPKGYSGPTFGANNGLASEAAKGQLHQSSGSQMAAPFLHLHLGQHPHLSNSLRLSQVTSIVSTPSFSGGSSAGQGQTDRFAGNTRDLFGELDAVPATGSPIIPGIVANAASLKPRPPFGNVIIDTAQLSRPVPNSEELLAYSAAMFKQQQEQARRAFNK